jgi:hypothetical protein
MQASDKALASVLQTPPTCVLPVTFDEVKITHAANGTGCKTLLLSGSIAAQDFAR